MIQNNKTGNSKKKIFLQSMNSTQLISSVSLKFENVREKDPINKGGIKKINKYTEKSTNFLF